MNNPSFVIAVSAFLLLATMFPGSAVFAGTGSVEVRSEYINNGHGVHYYLDSTVNDTVCAFPNVDNKENVYGGLGGDKFQMGPNEHGVSIGEFNQANQDYDWHVDVSAQWNTGECADQ
jgi:hypothetical protein